MEVARFSSTVFEIVKGKLVYRGWDVRCDHRYRSTSQGVIFGQTGVSLRLRNGVPELQDPEQRRATLICADHAFHEGTRVEGRFVEVRIPWS